MLLISTAYDEAMLLDTSFQRRSGALWTSVCCAMRARSSPELFSPAGITNLLALCLMPLRYRAE